MKYLKLTLLLLVVFVSFYSQEILAIKSGDKKVCNNTINLLLIVNNTITEKSYRSFTRDDSLCYVYHSSPVDSAEYNRLLNIFILNKFDSTKTTRELDFTIYQDSIIFETKKINLLVEKDRLSKMLKDSLSTELYEFIEELLHYKL